jgi:hypothetical protein
MFSDYGKELLRSGIIEARAGNKESARRYFDRALYIPDLLMPVQILSTSSANMTVESFRLNLLPVWLTEIPFGGRTHLMLINGQNGTVASDLPEKSGKPDDLIEYLADLLD